MPAVRLTPALTTDYQRLFDSCMVREERQSSVEAVIQKLEANRQRYEQVSAATWVPWYVVAVIHNMEASLDFSRHLHNGDSLQQRTTHVPAGRPKEGRPPFTWEESAIDALKLKKLHTWTDWSIPGILYKLEEYNGWGYRSYHPEVLSPYLWSYSNHYTSGKYVADGRWSATAVSKQCGAAALLRRMAEKGLVPSGGNGIASLPEAAPTSRDSWPLVRYAPGERSEDAAELQRLLNRVGLHVKVDGKAGEKTSEAFRKLTGFYLQGDPRAGGA